MVQTRSQSAKQSAAATLSDASASTGPAGTSFEVSGTYSGLTYYHVIPGVFCLDPATDKLNSLNVPVLSSVAADALKELSVHLAESKKAENRALVASYDHMRQTIEAISLEVYDLHLDRRSDEDQKDVLEHFASLYAAEMRAAE